MRARATVILLCAAAACLSAQPAGRSTSLSDLSASFQALSRRVNASVVKVVATGYRKLEDEDDEQQDLVSKQQTSGSGFFIDADGHLVTNAHVVAGAQRVTVTLPPRGRRLKAEVIGFDLETDVALLKVEPPDLPALEFADSDSVVEGQIVLAFGSPLGLDNSVSMGVISSTARQLKPDDAMVYLQTDAPINPGSSGGPLVDSEGRVVGINTLILSQSGGHEGIGFAAPSNVVRSVIEQLKTRGRVVRGEIGVTVQTITPLLAAGWQLPRDSGVVVADVDEDSSAAKAGLETGDIILSLNGKPMDNARQFNVALYRPPAGSKVKVEVQRGDKKKTLTVEVTEKQDSRRAVALANRAENLVPEFGIFCLDLTPELKSEYTDLRRDKGVVVVSLQADGPILEEPFKPGDAIYAVNREPVTGLASLRAILKQLHSGAPVAVQLERDGSLRFLSFELP